MTPTTDDSGRWLDAGLGVITALWAALGVLYWKLWETLATREWVVKMLSAQHIADDTNDRQLFADLIAPIKQKLANIEESSVAMHKQNSEKLDRILENQMKARG